MSGTAIYLSSDVFGWAAEWGWTNPFAFYFAGRGGMLGDVSHDVVTSAFGWFEPNAVKAMYSEGAATAGSTQAAVRMAEAHSKWGRKHFADVEGLEDHVAVTEELVDGIEGAAIPLFVGWRNAARCDTAAGRAAQLMQMLREWRGGLHLVSTTAAGLSPLEAILTNEGEGQAKFFGWAEPFPDIEAHPGQARRGRGHDGPPLRPDPGPGAGPVQIRCLRGGRQHAPRRDPLTSIGLPGPEKAQTGNRLE